MKLLLYDIGIGISEERGRKVTGNCVRKALGETPLPLTDELLLERIRRYLLFATADGLEFRSRCMTVVRNGDTFGKDYGEEALRIARVANQGIFAPERAEMQQIWGGTGF